MATLWPDNLSYKHATASERGSDASRRGANRQYQVYEHKSDNLDWPWNRPPKTPVTRNRLSEFQPGRRDSVITSNRQRSTWEEEGIRAAEKYVSQHGRPDAPSSAATRDHSWLRSLASQLSQQEGSTVPVTLPFDTTSRKHYGPSPPGHFLASEPVAVHTASVPQPSRYLSLTSDRIPKAKSPSLAAAVRLNAGHTTPPRKNGPTPHASPPRYSVESRMTPCSISLDLALKDMYETLHKAHTLFSSYQATFEEGAGPVIGRFKEEPLNLAWRDMIAEQFNTNIDKRQCDAVKERLGTRAKVVMASLHEHTPALDNQAYRMEERARAARKVAERMEEVNKLTHRAREERMGCRFLLEEVEQLMVVLDPKTHPRLYSDMEEKRWVGIGQKGSKQNGSRQSGRASVNMDHGDHGPKKSGSVDSDDRDGVEGNWGEAATDETRGDQPWGAEIDNTGDSGTNGNVSLQDNNDDHEQANLHDSETNWEGGKQSRSGTCIPHTGSLGL